MSLYKSIGLPRWLSGKESACSAGDARDLHLIPGLEDPLELKKNGNPLQYSCLENSVVRRAWWTTVHGTAKSWTRVSEHPFLLTQW